MKWFIEWHGDLDADPLNKGIDSFSKPDDVNRFKVQMESLGFTCNVWAGIESKRFPSAK